MAIAHLRTQAKGYQRQLARNKDPSSHQQAADEQLRQQSV